MANELIPAELLNNSNDNQALAVVSSSGDYLPYIQLMGSSSNEVKEDKIRQGHFALKSGKSLVDLSNEFVALLVAWRPKAMIFAPEIVVSYDVNSDMFKKIKGMAKGESAGYGAEFLMWLPDQSRLATYFLSNPTGRNIVNDVVALLPSQTQSGLCLFKSHLIKNKKFAWHGPLCEAYDATIETPPWAELIEQINKFKNPSTTGGEQIPVEQTRTR